MPGPKTNMHVENLNRGKVRFLSLISFFLGFLDSFFIYIISSYFVRVSGTENVGPFYIVAFIVVLALFLAIPSFLRRFGRIRLLVLVFLALFGMASFLSLREPSWWGATLLLLFIAVNNVMWVVMDIVLEGFSSDRLSGRVRGLYLTFMNGGLLVSPLLSTTTLETYGYGGVFAGLSFGYALVLVAVLLRLRDYKGVNVPKISLPVTLRKVMTNPNLLKIYHISFVIEFFYAMMIVYTPIYLTVTLGFRWEELGLIFTIMLIPFVILQYPLGVLADTAWGERELLLMSLFVMGAATALLAFLHSHLLLAWASVLFITRIGAAAIEVLRDAYFYKQVDGSEADTIAFFRTARPVGNIMAAMTAAVLLLFFPLPSLFLVIAFVIATALFSAYTLEDTPGEKEVVLHTTLKA